jgi:hypothetical protein
MNKQYKNRMSGAELLETKRQLSQDALVINLGIQHDGALYALDSWTQRRLKNAYPDAAPLRSLFLGHDKVAEFEKLNPPRWEQMVLMLTGLNIEQIAALGGARIWSHDEERVIWEWKPEVVRS